MKRIFTMMIMLLSGVIALNGQIVYFEGFDNGIPADYKTYDIDGFTPNANLNQGFKGAGWLGLGGAAYSISWYASAAKSNDWLVTKAITVPNVATPGDKMMLIWAEQTFDPAYPDGYVVYVNEKDQQVASFTTVLYTSLPAQTSSTRAYKALDLSAYAGKTIYLAFVNNTFDGYILTIDDIAVVELPENNLSTTRVNNLVYNKENSSILVNGSVLNNGWGPVTSFKFNYQIDNDPVQTADLSGLNLTTLNEGAYESTIPYTATFGKHNVNVWPTDINGKGVNGDTVSMQIYNYAPADYVTRTTMLEQFTSSTCPPCVAGNAKIKSVVAALSEKPIIVKYQQDFPGTGDPYATDETVNRRDYYSINAIPNSIIDGNSKNLNPQNLVAADITSSFEREALTTISMKYKIDSASHSIHVFGTYKPTVDLIEGTRLMIAIKENKTVKNIGTNGETEFDNVVKKLLPDENGTNMDGVLANSVQNVDVTYTFPGTYRLPLNGTSAQRINTDIENSVEEFTDLAATVWVENTRDLLVLNAEEALVSPTGTNEIFAIESFKVFPNPSKVVATASIKLNEDLVGKLVITDLLGHQLWSSDQSLSKGVNNIDLPIVNTLAVGTYHVTFRSGSKLAVQELIVQ